MPVDTRVGSSRFPQWIRAEATALTSHARLRGLRHADTGRAQAQRGVTEPSRPSLTVAVGIVASALVLGVGAVSAAAAFGGRSRDAAGALAVAGGPGALALGSPQQTPKSKNRRRINTPAAPSRWLIYPAYAIAFVVVAALVMWASGAWKPRRSKLPVRMAARVSRLDSHSDETEE